MRTIKKWKGHVINKSNYTLFEKNNPEIASIVLYVDVDVEIIKKERANIHKSIKKHMF